MHEDYLYLCGEAWGQNVPAAVNFARHDLHSKMESAACFIAWASKTRNYKNQSCYRMVHQID